MGRQADRRRGVHGTPLSVALMGTRGVPANYSGFETCVEELGRRLAERGHAVTVYCRRHHVAYDRSYYRGMRLVKLPAVRHKYLDTISHTALSTLHAMFSGYDVAIYFIAGNSPFTVFPRVVGTRTLINVDGLDWKRDKWPTVAKWYIQFAERLATVLPNNYVTDSRVVQEYYAARHSRAPLYIPYGSNVEKRAPGEVLKQFGLEPGRYVLFVGRLVPENRPHHLIDAFQRVRTDLKCVIVGDAPYAEAYKADLRRRGNDDPRVVFTGYVFGEGYRELASNAYCFVETSAVGGTHPALIEAMAFGNCVVVNGTRENLETIGDAGLHYTDAEGAAGLSEVLARLLPNPVRVRKLARRAEERARTLYDWEVVTDQYEQLMYATVGGGAAP